MAVVDDGSPVTVVVAASTGTVVVEPSPGAVVVDGAGRAVLGVEVRLGGEHRPEPELGGAADDLEGPLAVLDAGQVDDDRVALADDLGLGDAEGVDPGADDLDGLVERARRAPSSVGLVDDRGAALEVEAELRATSPGPATIATSGDGEQRR